MKGKIRDEEVGVVGVVVWGRDEEMMEIEEKGRVEEWWRERMEWVEGRLGREKVVGGDVEMEEKRGDMDGGIVGMVRGERGKGKKEEEEGKGKYEKKGNRVGLCGDEVLKGERLIG